MAKSTRDLIWAVFFSVMSIANYIYSDTLTSDLPVPRLAESGPYTKIWSVILFILSVCLLVRALRQKSSEEARPLLTLASILTIAAVTVYLLALTTVGFAPCTVIFLTFLITYYHWLSLKPEERAGVKTGWLAMRYLALSVVVTLFLNFAFGTLLKVYLPSGVFFQ